MHASMVFQYVQLQGLVNTVVTDQTDMAEVLNVIIEDTRALENRTEMQDDSIVQIQEEVRF